MKSQTKIYVLIDPDLLKVRYIGITCQSLIDRLDNHIHDAKYRESDNYHKARWINSLLSKNKKPIIRQIKLCNTRVEAEEIESQLILKYKQKHNLVNISEGNGEFTSKGQHSASVLNSKKIYVYNYDGSYYATYNSHNECADELGIHISGIEKCLAGTQKFVKGFQFSRDKVEATESLQEYSTGSSKEILILDNDTGKVTRYKSGRACREALNMPSSSTGIKRILADLNKNYGNRYSMLIDGEFTQSTYYNTGVIITCNGIEYKFQSKKDLLTYMGYKTKSIDELTLYDYIYKKFDNIENISFNQPLCLVINKDN